MCQNNTANSKPSHTAFSQFYHHQASQCKSLRPSLKANISTLRSPNLCPLRTPDWFERMPMKTSERFPFDPVVGKVTASTPDGRSSSGRSPPSENNSTIARQTPDPFEDRVKVQNSVLRCSSKVSEWCLTWHSNQKVHECMMA